jgi:putative phosphoesterase
VAGDVRIGLIADLHGNLFGLEAVLSELDQLGVDEIVCLGDVAVLGPRPLEVIETLRNRDIVTVCGNVDAWIGEGTSIFADPPTSLFTKTHVAWARARLNAAQLSWLGSLSMTFEREFGEIRAVFCHGSPASVDDIMINLSIERVGEFGHHIIVGGHSHRQSDVQIGTVRYLNPGSAGLPGVGPGGGLPVHERPDWIEYAVLRAGPDRIDVEMHRVRLNIDRLVRDATASGMPMLSEWRMLWGS